MIFFKENSKNIGKMKININPVKIFFLLAVFIVYCNIILQNSRFTLRNKSPKCKANNHSFCFLDMLVCHPGYTGDYCYSKLKPMNAWFYKNCPNLNKSTTYDPRMSTDVFFKFTEDFYLCFLHPDFGVPQIPIDLWKKLRESQYILKQRNEYADTGAEHLEGFDNYKSLPNFLGKYLEIGCGPYTQTQYIIDYNFETISLLDRSANNYMRKLSDCSYKNGSLFGKNLRVLSYGAEKLVNDTSFGKYDTIMSINGIEDAWDGYQYLTNIYKALKPGGTLILHEKFYPYPVYGDRIGDQKIFHSVKLTKIVYDHFLSYFKHVYKFEGQTIAQIKSSTDEIGFYFIGTKL